MTKATRYITKEYHEGFNAYENGFPLTSNPYLKSSKNVGPLWYWVWGHQDAMALDLRQVKQALLNIAQPIDKQRIN